MRHPRRRSGMPEATVFPFISVLLCTMGAMVLVWMSFSLAASLSDPRREQDAIRIEAENISLARVLSAGRARLTSLADLSSVSQQRLGSRNGDLAARSQSLGEMKRREQDLARQLSAIRADLAPLQAAEVRLADLQVRVQMARSIVAAEEQAVVLQGAVDQAIHDRQALTERRARLGQLAARDATIAKELDALKSGGRVVVRLPARRVRPVLVEVAKGGVRMLPEGAGGPLVPLSTALAEKGDLRRAAYGTADGTSSIFLLVRPGGVTETRVITSTLRELRAVFTTEPVDAEWDLTTLATQPADVQP